MMERTCADVIKEALILHTKESNGRSSIAMILAVVF
jgi:hypothetical protein